MIEIKLLPTTSISYPIGIDMKGTLNYIAQAAMEFQKIYGSRPYTTNLFCRGSSGAILAGLFTSHFPDSNMRIVHIKKEGEWSHSGCVSCGFESQAINVIIDDFISSGETIRDIYHKAKEYTDRGREFKIDVLIVGWGYREDLGFEPVYLISK